MWTKWSSPFIHVPDAPLPRDSPAQHNAGRGMVGQVVQHHRLKLLWHVLPRLPPHKTTQGPAVSHPKIPILGISLLRFPFCGTCSPVYPHTKQRNAQQSVICTPAHSRP
jgi:hypothetical protein